MKTFELKGTPRENLGKKMSKNLRKQDMIPAVLYGQEPVALPYTGKMNAGEKLVEIGDGKGIIVTDFSVSFDGVRKLIYTPEIHLVSIEMGDGRKVNAILKEIQFHALSLAFIVSRSPSFPNFISLQISSHSTFCICSRMRSRHDFASTTPQRNAVSPTLEPIVLTSRFIS